MEAFTGQGAERNGEFLFNGKSAEQIPVWKDGKVLEMEGGGDGGWWRRHNVEVLNATELHT